MAEPSVWQRFGAWHLYFEIRRDNGACYTLRNNVMTARSELTIFDWNGVGWREA